MGELGELTGAMRALKNVKEVELMGMAKLKKCVLMGGLKNVESVKMENAGKLESVKGLKELIEEERKKREEEERKKREEEERKKKEEEEERRKREEERKKREEMIALAKATVNVRNMGDLKNASISILVIVVASKCCNEGEVKEVDLGRFVSLKVFEVGDECFENVKEVKMIGLNQLEKEVIGRNSFTKEKNRWAMDSTRHFYLKNCERLRELKIGRYSFSDYAVCEIENVPSLEMIEMGELKKWSCTFDFASLKLKSDSQRMK